MKKNIVNFVLFLLFGWQNRSRRFSQLTGRIVRPVASIDEALGVLG
jgi:hypothetical protein